MANRDEENKNKCTVNPEHSENSARFPMRGKPQQQLYRPGSGPLRRSNFPDDNKEAAMDRFRDLEENTRNLNYNRPNSDRVMECSLSDHGVIRQKRPGRSLSKQINFSSDAINKCHLDNTPNFSKDSRINNNRYADNRGSFTKRYTTRHHSNVTSGYNQNRDVRHSSEPRSLPQTSRFHEDNSSENLERSHIDDRFRFKLYSDRGNENYMNVDNRFRDKTRSIKLNLPPRLQKKFLQENRYPLGAVSPEKVIPRGAQNSPQHQEFTKPMEPHSVNIADRLRTCTGNLTTWRQTLPLVRGRGRGIVRRTSAVHPGYIKAENSVSDVELNKQIYSSTVVPSFQSIEPHKLHYTPKQCLTFPHNIHSNVPLLEQSSISQYSTYDRNMYHNLGRHQREDVESLSSVDTEAYYNNENKQRNRQSDIDAINASENIHIIAPEKKLDWSEEVELQEEKDKQQRYKASTFTDTQNKFTKEKRSESKDRTLITSSNVVPVDSALDVDVSGISTTEHSKDRLSNSLTESSKTSDEPILTTVAPGVIILPQSHLSSSATSQRMLYNPSNPSEPIVINTQISNSRIIDSSAMKKITYDVSSLMLGSDYTSARPTWYDLKTRPTKHFHTIAYTEKLDIQLQSILKTGQILIDWEKMETIRQNLGKCLSTLLINDIKFCQSENIEIHFWKIMFYNIIEFLRKGMSTDKQSRDVYKEKLLNILDEAGKFYENLILVLENAYKYKLDDFMDPQMIFSCKELGTTGLCLISSQKIFLFLGDLARYKEQACDGTNYSKSKLFYMKAQQVNPKNARPYHQLAILSMAARRKVDAVFYYMRSLMLSQPFVSAKDGLFLLFDENRKKFQSMDRKRKAVLEKQQQAEEPESEDEERTRREIWIHPKEKPAPAKTEEEEMLEGNEDLIEMCSIELNKKFISSYIYVIGKIVTKIGMETFVSACRQMLLEFYLLLERSPLPLHSHRLLQLVALNMYAVDSAFSEPKERRSEVQERALGAALEMASLMFRRCITLISTQAEPPRLFVPLDVQVMLPALKVFCEWLLCHHDIWFPLPFSRDLRLMPNRDMWTNLAEFLTLVTKLEHESVTLLSTSRKGFSLIKLQEEITLCEFTPLKDMTKDRIYAPETIEPEAAQIALRLHKIQFVADDFLCEGVEPLLKKMQYRQHIKYVSLVKDLIEKERETPIKIVEDEPEVKKPEKKEVDFENDPTISAETKCLLIRRRELERQRKMEEDRDKYYKKILHAGYEILELVIKPKFLVPDTNCFIDYLDDLVHISDCGFFTLMVPLTVINELEGLSRGSVGREEVALCAIEALKILREKRSSIKFLTIMGNVLSKPDFMAEEAFTSNDIIHNNDDRILASALNLCQGDQKSEVEPATELKPRVMRMKREVVLLSMDRNLRIKALSSELPVRDLPAFVKWAFEDNLL